METSAKVLTWIAVGVPVILFMELWSAVLHGRVWHRALWFLHASHHAPQGKWERNDILSVTHAPIAMALIVWGCIGEPGLAREIGYGVGVGMTIFGLAYIVVHDGLIHGRLPVGFLSRFRYLRLVRNAHLVHHRKGEAPYGLFSGPWVVRRMSRERER